MPLQNRLYLSTAFFMSAAAEQWWVGAYQQRALPLVYSFPLFLGRQGPARPSFAGDDEMPVQK